MRYKGGCHCAKIAFEVEGDLTEAIECNCSICYESGYLHWMIERSQLRMITPLSEASLYIYGRPPRWQEGSESWSGGDRLQTSIRRHHFMVRPNGISAHTFLDKWSASRAIIKVRV